MIFVTIGSRSFQFNRLLKALDDAVESNEIKDDIYAQIGSSDYKPKNYKYIEFLDHDQFNQKINECDIVITHGGTGVIINSIKRGKKVIGVPRLKQFNEVVDDHQIQLVKRFEKLNLIEPCYNLSNIAETIKQVKVSKYKQYVSNTDVIIKSIEDFIEKN